MKKFDTENYNKKLGFAIMITQENEIPNLWEKIYKEQGIIQHEPIVSVAKLAEFLIIDGKTHSRILDAGVTLEDIFFT